MSYWNRPFFPEWCSDALLDDSKVYDTMVRIVGSFAGIAQAFKVVADELGWTHIVSLSDEETSSLCWKQAKPVAEIFDNDRNYSFTWLRFGSNPTDEEFDDILQQIRSRTRGFYPRHSHVNVISLSFICYKISCRIPKSVLRAAVHTVCLNSFGNRTSPSDNSNDR